jgi:hypothetical protein
MNRYESPNYQNEGQAVRSQTIGGGMTPENRQKMLDYNEELCRMYNQDESEDTKRLIAFTEFMLFHDPDHVSTEVLEIESV